MPRGLYLQPPAPTFGRCHCHFDTEKTLRFDEEHHEKGSWIEMKCLPVVLFVLLLLSLPLSSMVVCMRSLQDH
jgi:hypothetical protein